MVEWYIPLIEDQHTHTGDSSDERLGEAVTFPFCPAVCWRRKRAKLHSVKVAYNSTK